MTSAELPHSLRRKTRFWFSPVWIIPLFSAVGLGYFVYHESMQKGPTISVQFVDGSGLQPRQTSVRYRGVRIGQVDKVELSEDLSRAVAEIELDRTAEKLAREGSLFWIVRPSVSGSGISGLGTIVTGAYIVVIPGNGAPSARFYGLEHPPAIEGQLRGLQLYLISRSGASFNEGTPVLYHGIKVGAVAESLLSNDAQNSRSRIVIERPYQVLVRTNSQFWNSGGMHFRLGITGLHANAQSLRALITGAISFATPDSPGTEASDNAEFTLNDKAKSEWLGWWPKIPLRVLPPESVTPADR